MGTKAYLGDNITAPDRVTHGMLCNALAQQPDKRITYQYRVPHCMRQGEAQSAKKKISVALRPPTRTCEPPAEHVRDVQVLLRLRSMAREQVRGRGREQEIGRHAHTGRVERQHARGAHGVRHLRGLASEIRFC